MREVYTILDNRSQELKFGNKIKAYLDDAMSSNYDHLLAVSVEMVDKCNERVAD